MPLLTHAPSPSHPAVAPLPGGPDPAARAAAMAQHPSAGGEAPVVAAASFADTVRLLTGSWRVEDPAGFADAMLGAPMIAGYPVLDAAEAVGYSPDPWSIRRCATVRAVLGGLPTRRNLQVARVAAEQAGRRITEARALAPAAGAAVACFVVAHLVDGPGTSRRPGGAEDPSWAVMVVGDRRGGVGAVVRARFGRPSAPPLRVPLLQLRERLTRDPEEVPAGDAATAVVVPFRLR